MNVSTMDEEMLITHCISEGYDNEALKELISRYGQLILQTITWTFKRYSQVIHEDVEDVFQDVFTLLFKNQCIALQRFDPEKASLGTYLCSIAKNCAITNLKLKKYKEVTFEDTFESNETTVESMLEDKENIDKIKVVIKTCSSREQLFYKLYYEDNMPCEEIAQLLGVSIDTIYSKKAKIIDKLKNAIHVSIEK